MVILLSSSDWFVDSQAVRGGGVAISGSIPERTVIAGTCGNDRTTGYADIWGELTAGSAAEQAIAQCASAPFDPGAAGAGQCCIGIAVVIC